MKQIILASQSPRRKQLLEWAEVPFEVITQATAETYPPGMALEEIPVHIARGKAEAVRAMVQSAYHGQHKSEIILAADTLVMLGNRVIGKPADREDAIAILGSLAGQTHRVITGVVILHAGGELAFSDVTEVRFHPLTTEQISFYVDKYQPYDKAGAYAIQEWIGVTGIASINGDFYNVMGLPVSRVVQALATV